MSRFIFLFYFYIHLFIVNFLSSSPAPAPAVMSCFLCHIKSCEGVIHWLLTHSVFFCVNICRQISRRIFFLNCKIWIICFIAATTWKLLILILLEYPQREWHFFIGYCWTKYLKKNAMLWWKEQWRMKKIVWVSECD